MESLYGCWCCAKFGIEWLNQEDPGVSLSGKFVIVKGAKIQENRFFRELLATKFCRMETKS